ncbi:Response regulator receiver domain-containing protein [Desulfomicrobium norvegicum]|uniref:Response regulator receiver domain-containing protein n=1 Tax=Desulfomicrobium norvegicum (strain DSM 1741 / NCIMB 8310) TaxID=52561 RepID=A0A8G2C043_DESNO|nr:response regulator [Desulfomicrobium norvegicum]SFL30657.1 Response regulator receiver domain-containing protein [Desulfomicrobium norvegicum]
MSSLEDCKLLFVDDEEEFLGTMAKYLRRKKLDVATASSGRAGLDWFGNHPVDIVVLDMKMPDLGGIEVLREMRRLKGEDFGVIILSGHAHTGLALEAMRAGADDFLLKPCSVENLLERIDLLRDRLLERRSA